MKRNDNIEPCQSIYFDIVHDYRRKVSHQRRKIMRKLNYRKKRATFQGYDPIMYNNIEDSRDLERNKNDFMLFFEESKFCAKPKIIETILQRRETDDYSGQQLAFCSHPTQQTQNQALDFIFRNEFLPFDYK